MGGFATTRAEGKCRPPGGSAIRSTSLSRSHKWVTCRTWLCGAVSTALVACMLGIPAAAARQLSAAASVDPEYVELTQTLEQRAFTLQNYAQQGAAAAAQRAGSATAALRVGPPPGVAPEDTTVASPNLATVGATQRTAVAANSTATLCGNGVCDAGESCSNCPMDCKTAAGQPCQRIGIMYSGWHQPAWNAAQNIRNRGSVAYDVEDILRTQTYFSADTKFRGTSMSAVLNSNGQEDAGLNFYWHVRPQQNFYCIVHSRNPGNQLYNKAHESAYTTYTGVPDCAGWQATAQRHAQQLVAAGIDYVVVDGTNIETYDPTADSLQLRPLQVLFEVWSAMRAAGQQTPDIAAWQRLPFSQSLSSLNLASYSFPLILKLYNTASYDRLVLRDRGRNKKIFFYPSLSPVDSTVISYIQSNGGLNNVIAQPMWVGQQGSGGWSFFSFCSNKAQLTDTGCNQKITPSSSKATGSQLAVSPSYQLTYASLPNQAIGEWSGMTFRQQWATALATNTIGGNSMGVDLDKIMSGKTFVDIYGGGFGRDIEPTVEGGTVLYDTTASCIRVFRNQVATGSTVCPTREACCTGTKFSLRFRYYDGGRGIFGMYANGQPTGTAPAQVLLNPQKGDPPAVTKTRYLDKRISLWVCTSKKLHPTWPSFFATTNTCDNVITGSDRVAKQIGYIAVNKGRGFLRALRRCKYLNAGVNMGRRDIYTFGTGCPHPWLNDKVLGYVR